jgi:hypothetical protein
MASGLKARMVFGPVAGIQTITVTCNLPASSAAATTGARRRSRRHRRRQRRRAATTVGACTEENSTDTAASATAATASGDAPTAPTPPSPEAVSQSPKRIRRRRNEVELLRGAEGEEDLLLSPLSCTTPPSTFPSPSPSRALTSSMSSPRSRRLRRWITCRLRLRRARQRRLSAWNRHPQWNQRRLPHQCLLPTRHRRPFTSTASFQAASAIASAFSAGELVAAFFCWTAAAFSRLYSRP